ncbi:MULTISPECIES: hypothetical protein [unclassified Halomonas]|uniref:hypothetical protein n=1 Tax=unclassified Halomonas TaxID=2609666 RepID=UPI0007DA1DFA|nr:MULTISPECIES: hypothetical protein [unclassified Halomonas]MBT2787331.1 hypothetical protein [Halomonas sp. ISL-106]MBT2796307.1 hypothetical protein [Halomonas sp. ISL-104]OAL57544.1 hypothetical protein A6R74_12280 [Halomonas sp. ALS9]
MAAERRPGATYQHCPHKPTPATLRAAPSGALTLTPRYENPKVQLRARTVARGNESREARANEAPANGGGTTPWGTQLTMPNESNPAPLRAAPAGALTLTPRYENPRVQLRARTVARGNESREARAYEAPAGGGGTTPKGTEPTPAPLRAAPAGALTLTPRYENPKVQLRARTVARGNESREARANEAPANGGGTTPWGTQLTMPNESNPAPLRAAPAGALTLTPRYENPKVQLRAHTVALCSKKINGNQGTAVTTLN